MFNTNDDEITADSDVEGTDELDLEEEENLLSNKLKGMKDKLKRCQEEKGEHLEELHRVRADFLNSKKRLQEQSLRDVERAMDSLLIDLLPVADSFELAMSNTKVWDKCDPDWRKGIEAIYTQLHSIFMRYGVEEINATGVPFDPNIHEAMSVEETQGGSDIVLKILQKGYRRNEIIIRPAKVVSSK